jgi:MFS family permease
MLAYSVLAGVGCGVTSSIAINIVVHWFDRRRGLAMGVIFMCSSLGGVTFPLVMKSIFGSMSWANCMRIIASIVALMMIVGNLCIRGRKVERTEESVDLKDFLDLKFVSVTLGLGCK